MPRVPDHSVLFRGASAGLAAGLLASLAGQASAQCEQWLAGGPLRGIGPAPVASVLWDPDGTGPRGEELAVAGSLLIADGTLVANVATWDGTRWNALGSTPAATAAECVPGGLCFARVTTILVHNGELVVAGQFTVGDFLDNRTNIARWTGTQWEAVGVGASGADAGLPFEVLGVASLNGSLIAVARDGTYGLQAGVWQLLDASRPFEVNDVVVHAGQLYRAGRLGSSTSAVQQAVERWDGGSWVDAWGSAQAGWGFDLLSAGGELFAAVSDLPGGPRATGSRVARFDVESNEWVDVGAGAFDAGLGTIQTLGVVGGELYAGGTFTQIPGSTAALSLARLSGTDWVPVGPASGPSAAPGVRGRVRSIAEFGGALAIIGDFTSAGQTPAANAAAFDGTAWRALASGGGSVGLASALAVNGDDVFVAGNLSAIGSVSVNQVAANDGTGWRALGDGLDGVIFDAAPFADGVAVARTLADFSASQVMYWNGSAWTQLGSDFALDSFPFISSGALERLEVVSGELYALLRTSSSPVRRWNGQDWEAVGLAEQFASAYAATEYNGLLVAGGVLFTGNDATFFNPAVAFLNPQGEFQDLGPDELTGIGVQGIISDVEVFNGDLYAAGSTVLLNGEVVSNIVRFNGTSWSTVAGGVTGAGNAIGSANVIDMIVYDGHLVVAGIFEFAGGQPARNIAKWDGQTWSALGAGVGRAENPVDNVVEGVARLAVQNGELIAAGAFFAAGENPSAVVARWSGLSGPTCQGDACNYDYNQDENVDLTDAQLMAQVAAGLIIAQPGWLDGDLNGDENADLTDAQQLAQFVATGNCPV